jgi:2-C-methyl-D-erythritol 2,4-cyclodiphosphate synthase
MNSLPIYRTGIGQDSHRFLTDNPSKPCILGGVVFEEVPGLDANSDGDVVFHSICAAITSLTGVLILGGIADDLYYKNGITDSKIYIEKALQCLGKQKIVHVALSLEAKRPKMKNKLLKMREMIATVLKLEVHQVGITVTSGEGLTDFGCGEGIQCMCILTTLETP